MSDWDTVTKIGSRVSGGPSQRETVVKGRSALNAAQRSGAIVGTEKKYTTGNLSNKSTSEGTRMTKIDRADDVVAPTKVSADVGKAIQERRSQEGQYKMTQAQLAQKVNAQANDIKALESGTAIKNQQLLNKVCRVLNISSKTGLPLEPRKK